MAKKTDNKAKKEQPAKKESGKSKLPKVKWRYPLFILLLLLSFGAYYVFWNYAAERIADQYVAALAKVSNTADIKRPLITGFPGQIILNVNSQKLDFPRYSAEINVIHGRITPLPRAPLKLFTGPIVISDIAGYEMITLDSFNAAFNIKGKTLLEVHSSTLTHNDFTARAIGTIDLKQQPFPRLDLEITLSNPDIILSTLVENGLLQTRFARFLDAGMQTLANEDGTVTVPIYQRDRTLYLGPLPVIMNLPQTYEAEGAFQIDGPRLEPYNQLGPDQ